MGIPQMNKTMINSNWSRRKFIQAASLGSAAALTTGVQPVFAVGSNSRKLAILGGTAVRSKSWPDWPAMLADDNMISVATDTIRSGDWSRIDSPVKGTVAQFEKKYAELMGVPYCIGTGSGTQALSSCVRALEIGPGDEVITSPYTDFGTITAIISAGALPVLADLDPGSFQLDASDVGNKITERTKAIMPVHMMGSPCEMDAIMNIAKKHSLFIIEDACQANFSKYRGQQLGTIGDLGCFSFQSSKQISCGEGGAVIGSNEDLMDKVYTIQNHGTNRKGVNVTIGQKFRMNEFEGAILIAQLGEAKTRFAKRNENAAYLDSALKEFKGLSVQKKYVGTENCGYYLYAMSYHQAHFKNASRDQFLKAMRAEGIPLSPYIKGLHTQPWTDYILQRNEYKTIFSKARLRRFKEELHLPVCDTAGEEIVVLAGSGPLLGSKSDMDDVVNAIHKVSENADSLAEMEP